MFRSTTRSSSRSRRPIWSISRSATSRGERIVQRPAGQSASSRRPSSNAAVSWAAFAAPTPGTASSSSVARPGEAGQPVVPGEGVLGQVDRRPAARARSPTAAPISSAAVRPAGAAHREPLARPLRCGHLADRAAADRDRRARRPRPSPASCCAADQASPDPDDGSPPIPPAIRIREHDEPYRPALIGRSTGDAGSCRVAWRGPGPVPCRARRGQRRCVGRANGRPAARPRPDPVFWTPIGASGGPGDARMALSGPSSRRLARPGATPARATRRRGPSPATPPVRYASASSSSTALKAMWSPIGAQIERVRR